MGNLSEITGNGWDAEAEAKKGGFAPLPVGDYVVIVASSNVKATKDGKGRYVAMEYQVVEGEYSGRKVWDNLNLWNPSEQAMAIAKASLANLQQACRLPRISDTSELHGIPFVMSLGQRKDAGTGEIRNNVKAYNPKGANMTPVATGGNKASPF